jgi:hypothetical protein
MAPVSAFEPLFSICKLCSPPSTVRVQAMVLPEGVVLICNHTNNTCPALVIDTDVDKPGTAVWVLVGGARKPVPTTLPLLVILGVVI